MIKTESPDALIQLQTDIEALRKDLTGHTVYARLQTLEDLQQFMQYHVYAVWDFMSLLKSLQTRLTSVILPWLPVGDAKTRYLINEIVLGEESDVDDEGNYTSHFELYLRAMQQAGCDTTAITQLIGFLEQGFDLQTAIVKAKVPEGAARFMRHTFKCCQQETYIQAAVFTFGREDLIPAMFLSLVDRLAAAHAGKADLLRYYLNRHIEVDGDHHSHLAYEMTARLCDGDPLRWLQATTAAKDALKARIGLWDAIMTDISAK